MAIVRVLATVAATVALTVHGDLPAWSALFVLAGIAMPADVPRLMRMLGGRK